MVYHLTNDQIKAFLGPQQNKFKYESTIVHDYYEPLTFSAIQLFWQKNKNYNFPFSLDTLKMTKTQNLFVPLQNMGVNEILNYSFEKDKSYFYIDSYDSSFFWCSLDSFSIEKKLIFLILRINSYFLFSMSLLEILPLAPDKERYNNIYELYQLLQARQIIYFSMFDYYVMQKGLLFSAMRYFFLCLILAKSPPSVIDFITKDTPILITFIFSTDNDNDMSISNKKELIFFAQVFCEKKKARILLEFNHYYRNRIHTMYLAGFASTASLDDLNYSVDFRGKGEQLAEERNKRNKDLINISRQKKKDTNE